LILLTQGRVAISCWKRRFEVFDKGVFTPNDQFYVRWHWALIPTDIDVAKFSLTVRGHVNQTLSLSLNDILHGLPSVQLSAVNQCSGNSRGFFQPRVTGGQWANGAMGNALWTGVRLKDLLDKAGEAGAGVITWTAKPAQKHDPSNVRWIKDLSCRSE
jgi:DMSO/TMAO reductase YedYZ molybdopterin-dependent catalytic subunit